MSAPSSEQAEDMVRALRALHAQLQSVPWPRQGDLVGRELQTMERTLRRLLRELGERDSVDP